MKPISRSSLQRAATWTFSLLAMLLVPGAWGPELIAQQASVQGIVLDRATSQPIPRATVTVDQAGQEVRSVLTDSNGLFQFGGLAAGSYGLRIVSFGYTAHEEAIELAPAQRLTANRSLTPDPLQLEGVDVAGQGPGAVRRELGGQMITSRDLGRIPTPAASGDLVSYLQTMPGVVGTGDRGGQLFIRGGTPSENMVLMDGMLVYQPFHITGFFSVFPEDLVDRAEFFPGGFGAKYVGRVSSVLDVGMRDGRRSDHSVAASVSPFLAEVLAEGPLYHEGSPYSFIFSARRSLIEETSPWLLGEQQQLRFDSYYMKLSSLGQDGGSRCSLTALRSNDVGGLDPDDEQSRIRWTNTLAGGRCTSLAGEIFFDAKFGFSRISNAAITRGASEFSSSASRIFMEADASRTLGRVRLNFGAFTHFKDVDYEFVELFTHRDRRTGWAGAGIYGEATIPIGTEFRLVSGAAVPWYPQTFRPTIEPRLRASWRPRALGDGELSGALGVYEQRLSGITDRRDASSVFTAWVRPVEEAKIEALHAQMSWQQGIGPHFSWSLDGYYRRLQNLPVSTWSTIATFTPDLSLADGRVHGADARVEYRRGPLYAFAAYGYSWTEYASAQDDFGVWFGEPVVSYHPPHDRRHQANALASLELGRYTVSARWEFGSGFPFTQPIGFDELFDFRTDLPSVRGRYGDTRLLLDRPYNARLPATHRLDVSAERSFDIRGRQIELQAGVINAYNQTNIFYYDVFTNRRVDQLPFAPYASVRFRPRATGAR
jgi:hypothetical protein